MADFLTVALSMGQWRHNGQLHLIKAVLQENKPYGPDVWRSACVAHSKDELFWIYRNTWIVFHSGNLSQIYIVWPYIWILNCSEFKISLLDVHLGAAILIYWLNNGNA